MAELTWTRGYGEAGSCIEVAQGLMTDWVFVRNSDDPRTEFAVSWEDWVEFVRAVKAGEFDGVGRNT